MRLVVMLLLGLAIGIFGTVTALSAMRQRTPLSKGVMAVTAHHFGLLRRQLEQASCPPQPAADHLRRLQSASADLHAAFVPTGSDDTLFARRAEAYRNALADALSRAPADCDDLQHAVREIGDACKQCHDDFR